ncbi:MAG: hypothetical protein UX44_C0014G0012 [candidate division WWE3 bacterium GW2011_GWA1_46_21]|uniref:Uncharacterized protein n=4 Tax=Katanobacteria TaxID=422282 RepID=A0A0G1PDK0_UNCKA|nr:MAG: hypothetical protein UX44_C0014G0012 [candidate division WWE3 bacterium GW2011_GWA1_46_21]KKU49368.1 MAG: hypothetical protein UX69_C0003G0020 [candidate division WWE3 bacterium GW2011_GWA2_46_9]KKU51268.1 MAG: hypothetical protein UX73_C0004G0014 [candidate division WWE3 bacterium GW2011_GWC1_47_10]KKU57941.1 MAG: hypothetical protein UX79_C0003G0011 [candidate division WWE3 bacterium GW2011_GWB1_47_11]
MTIFTFAPSDYSETDPEPEGDNDTDLGTYEEAAEIQEESDLIQSNDPSVNDLPSER